MEAIVFIGIQAAGKSTFYRERFFKTHIRINLDMLKTRHRERLLFQTCLDAKQPVVIDNTNLTAEDRARYIPSAKAAHFRVIGYYFQSSLDDALRRNEQRVGKECIPPEGIRAAHRRLQLPAYSEGFDALFCVALNGEGGFTVEEWQP